MGYFCLSFGVGTYEVLLQGFPLDNFLERKRRERRGGEGRGVGEERRS